MSGYVCPKNTIWQIGLKENARLCLSFSCEAFALFSPAKYVSEIRGEQAEKISLQIGSHGNFQDQVLEVSKSRGGRTSYIFE